MFDPNQWLNPYPYIVYFTPNGNYLNLTSMFKFLNQISDPSTLAFHKGPYPTSQNLQEITEKDPSYDFQITRDDSARRIISLPQYSQKQQRGKQLNSRNILPNNINLILSYIRRVNRSGKTVERIIKRLKHGDESFSSKQFYSYQLYLRDNLTSTTSQNALKTVIYFCDPSCAIFSIQEQHFYNQVCRILVRHFLKEEAIVNLLLSKKMFKTKREDHLKSYRMINDDIKMNDLLGIHPQQ